MKSLLKRLFLFLITVYRYTLAPFLGGHCRFQPSCSEYTRRAIEEHGALSGAWLGLKRLLRCHPFSSDGGFDPVPPTDDGSTLE